MGRGDVYLGSHREDMMTETKKDIQELLTVSSGDSSQPFNWTVDEYGSETSRVETSRVIE